MKIVIVDGFGTEEKGSSEEQSRFLKEMTSWLQKRDLLIKEVTSERETGGNISILTEDHMEESFIKEVLARVIFDIADAISTEKGEDVDVKIHFEVDFPGGAGSVRFVGSSKNN